MKANKSVFVKAKVQDPEIYCCSVCLSDADGCEKCGHSFDRGDDIVCQDPKLFSTGTHYCEDCAKNQRQNRRRHEATMRTKIVCPDCGKDKPSEYGRSCACGYDGLTWEEVVK